MFNITLKTYRWEPFNFEVEFMEENGYINVSRLCERYEKKIDDWKNVHYNELYESLQQFCQHNGIQHYQPIEYKGEWFLDPSLALHIGYWIGPSVGIYLCAFYFGILFGSVKI